MADLLNNQRWATLKQSIIQARDAMTDDRAARAMNRQVNDKLWCQADDLAELLDRLITFADAGMKWLNKTATALEKSGATRVLNRYPPQYAQHLLIQQVIYDFRIIWHVYTQRRDNVDGIHEAIAALATVAQDAFTPAINAGLLTQPSRTILYLQKTSSIRILPYAKIALIGLPSWLSTINSKTSSSSLLLDDLHAIAHEVGHHVYWHGTAADGNGQRHTVARLIKRYVLQNYTEANEEIMKQWSEEIFADIYGLLYAGPSSVAALFEVILDRHWRNEMFDVHDVHPAPLIRPLSLLAVLEASGQAEQAAALRAAWHTKPYIASLLASNSTQEVRELENELKALARYIYGLFQNNSEPVLPGSAFGYHKKSASLLAGGTQAVRADLLPELLRGWRKDIAKVIQKEVAPATDMGETITWAAWIEHLRAEYRALGLTSIDEGNEMRLSWVVAQSAGGWTEGPTNGGNRP